MIREFIIRIEDTLKGAQHDIDMLEIKWGAEELPKGHGRLIDADKIIALAHEDGAYDYISAYDIANLPSVTPIRVKGEWQITDFYPHNVYCSECHTKFAQTHWAVWEDGSLPRNYCPNCGADMRGDKHDKLS